MSHTSRSDRRGGVWVLSALLEAQTYTSALHLLLDLPLGVVSFAGALTGLVAVAILSITLLGPLVLATTLVVALWWARIERGRARALLGIALAEPHRPTVSGGPLRQLRTLLTDPAAWKALGYGLIMLPVGIFNGVLTLTVLFVALLTATYPAYFHALPHGGGRWNEHVLNTPLEVAVISAGGILLLVAWPWLVRGMAALDRQIIAALLGASGSPPELGA